LLAVTVDHGLRPQARREAAAVKRLAATLGIPHRTVRWTGAKPASGLQAKARAARYRLLADAARRHGAEHLVTAHTLDDQAETVLFRLARGSGLTGLAGMARVTPLGDAWLIRPFLDLPKARLVASLAARKVAFAEDPSNLDPRFTRVRWRALMPALAQEGLHAARVAAFAARMRRANAAIEIVVDAVAEHAAAAAPAGPIVIAAGLFDALPEEIAVRLIGRAVAAAGDEGPVELGKLETVVADMAAASRAHARLRRTLAGAMMTVAGDRITVERAPARRNSPKKSAKKGSRS
jgi:tRNA(Ile)-lysidine synthase